VGVLCLLAAGLLVLAHGVRFAMGPDIRVWWVPVVLLVGAVLADFTSGLVHWAADTWGSEATPWLGPRFLRPFRVHHSNPDDILRRGFVDLNGDTALLAVPVLLAAWLVPLETVWGRVPAVLLVAWATFSLPTNQIHQWAHQSNPPRLVRWLQRRGLILGPAHHRVHHIAPFATHYCITTGWCNLALAALGLFEGLERMFSRLTGAEPRRTR
jgi:ubiquitin-conjugating enzyme E2 variant